MPVSPANQKRRLPFIRNALRTAGTAAFASFLVLLMTTPVSAEAIPLYSSENYNLNFQFMSYFGTNEYAIALGDIDGNGFPDIVVADWGADFNGRNDSGSLYVIFDYKFRSIDGTGNVIDMADPANFDLRFDGSGAAEELGDAGVAIGDIDNDGMNDIICGSWADTNGSDSGALYVITNDLLTSLAETGSIFDLSNASNFSMRIDGAGAGELFTATGMWITDLNNNGKNDLVVSAGYAGSRFYVFYDDVLDNYPGIGQVFNLADPNNYSLKFNGPSGTRFSYRDVHVTDVDQNGTEDILIGASGADFNGRLNSGSLYIFLNESFSSITGPGITIDVSGSTNFSLRLDGPAESYGFSGSYNNVVGDLDGNGLNDLVAAALGADNNGRTNSGSVYIIYDELLQQFLDLGEATVIDMLINTNWHVRFDGAVAGDYFGWGGYGNIAEFNNNGINDLMLGAAYADPESVVNAGSYYIFYDEIIPGSDSVGQTVDLLDPAHFSLRYAGSAGSYLSANQSSFFYDLNSDGREDLVLGGKNLGNIYVIYNFPHTITVNSVPSPVGTDSITISGSISSLDSVTEITGVEFSVDVGTFDGGTGGWVPCTATDGTFDSQSESFSCTVSSLSEGAHTIYIRAYDSQGKYTSMLDYSTTAVVVDLSAPEGTIGIVGSEGSTVNTETIAIQIEVSDEWSSVTEMIFSFDPAFTGAMWEPFSSDKTLTLPSGNGEKIIYYRFKDGAGNVSEIFSFTVTLYDSLTETGTDQVRAYIGVGFVMLPISIALYTFMSGRSVSVLRRNRG